MFTVRTVTTWAAGTLVSADGTMALRETQATDLELFARGTAKGERAGGWGARGHLVKLSGIAPDYGGMNQYRSPPR